MTSAVAADDGAGGTCAMPAEANSAHRKSERHVASHRMIALSIGLDDHHRVPSQPRRRVGGENPDGNVAAIRSSQSSTGTRPSTGLSGRSLPRIWYRLHRFCNLKGHGHEGVQNANQGSSGW